MRTATSILKQRRLRVAILALSALIALVAAVTSVREVSLFPPRLEPKQLEIGVATTAAMVDPAKIETDQDDRTDRTYVDALTETVQVDSLSERTNPLAKVIASPPVVDRMARRLELDPERISAVAQSTNSVPRSLIEPANEQRANEILASYDPYRLEVQAASTSPVLEIFTQAPSAAEAERLADVAVAVGDGWLQRLARERNIGSADRVHLTQLGAARSGVVDPKVELKVAGLTFLVVFAVACGALFLLAAIIRGWQRTGRPSGVPDAQAEGWFAPPPAAQAVAGPRGGDWPRTTRVLPWMIAAFLALLWLVPFNAIALDVSLPVDLNLDRLVLPVIVITWALALAIGGATAPRLRFTPIHAGIAVFAAAAGLSVVLNLTGLNQTLGLELAIKKVTLLIAFLSLFVVVASVVRRTEVQAFLNFMLALAAICALGMIWEYRSGFNVFYEWSASLLPGFFEVLPPPEGFDELGRRSVSGPADHGLEAVAMLSMVLAVALVGMMRAPRWHGRILYGIAACLIGAAAVATYRKSALLAPLSVGLTLAYFRRRELLRLAPLAAVALVALLIVSFSALGSIANQFDRDQLDVATVGDRVSDYDAVRPDILTNPAFGLGFGTYEHSFSPTSYRILDSDLLMRVVEMGLIGLAAFLFMVITVIVVASPIIRGRDPGRADMGLVAAAAAVAFLILSALFDQWSFPHAPYVFLTLAGLLAVVYGPDPDAVPERLRTAVGLRRREPAHLPPAPNGANGDSRRVPTPV